MFNTHVYMPVCVPVSIMHTGCPYALTCNAVPYKWYKHNVTTLKGRMSRHLTAMCLAVLLSFCPPVILPPYCRDFAIPAQRCAHRSGNGPAMSGTALCSSYIFLSFLLQQSCSLACIQPAFPSRPLTDHSPFMPSHVMPSHVRSGLLCTLHKKVHVLWVVQTLVCGTKNGKC